MDDLTHHGAPVFLLPEDSFYALQELRNQMFLMAAAVFVSTQEEERIPLRLPRSMLAQCFQVFASQLSDALDEVQPLAGRAPRMH
jgi:hypothetical protein